MRMQRRGAGAEVVRAPMRAQEPPGAIRSVVARRRRSQVDVKTTRPTVASALRRRRGAGAMSASRNRSQSLITSSCPHALGTCESSTSPRTAGASAAAHCQKQRNPHVTALAARTTEKRSLEPDLQRGAQLPQRMRGLVPRRRPMRVRTTSLRMTSRQRERLTNVRRNPTFPATIHCRINSN